MCAQQRYCFAAVHLPVQPSDCLNVPPPVRPDRRPTVMTVRPFPLEVPYTRPSELTVPLAVWPIILPLVTTTALLLVPEQVTPTELTIHAPSKLLLPPPPLFRDARRGSSASGLLRRAGASVARGASREPDSDFSSLPMLPPALPDCASATPPPDATETKRESSAIPVECRTASRFPTAPAAQTRPA